MYFERWAEQPGQGSGSCGGGYDRDRGGKVANTVALRSEWHLLLFRLHRLHL